MRAQRLRIKTSDYARAAFVAGRLGDRIGAQVNLLAAQMCAAASRGEYYGEAGHDHSFEAEDHRV